MDIDVLFMLLALALGLLLGWAIGYFSSRGGASGADKDKAQAYDKLKDDVGEHMEESARLMDDLSDNYRRVYEHLAIGSQRFAGKALETQARDLEGPTGDALAHEPAEPTQEPPQEPAERRQD